MTTDTQQQTINNQNLAKAPTAVFRSFLEKHKQQLAMALPKHLNPDRMSRLAMTSFNSNRKLQQCDPTSVFGAVVFLSQLGLEVGVMGQGFLVPYNDRKRGLICQGIPGWMGIVDLVSRTGRATVWTGAVFEGDHFEYALGSRQYVEHRPAGEDDPDKLTHVYACGVVKGMEHVPVIEVWSIPRVRRHRNKYNKVGDSHYSFSNWEMYARKVPLLQVCKYMPKSIELTAAVTAEFAHESGRTIQFDGESVIFDGDEDQQDRQPATGKGTAGLREAVSGAGSQQQSDAPPPTQQEPAGTEQNAGQAEPPQAKTEAPKADAKAKRWPPGGME